MIDARSFLNDVIRPFVEKLVEDRLNGKFSPTKIGTIDSSYSGGKASVRFDGENTVSLQRYVYLSPYTPSPDDRVLLLRSGRTWVILGRLEAG